MARTRIDRIDSEVAVWIDRDLSPAAQSKAFASFVRKDIERVRADNARVSGKAPDVSVQVDGRKGAPLESVGPNGRILAEFDVALDIIGMIRGLLVENSPELSGEYKSSHILFADGVEVPGGSTVPAAEEYIFLNPVPYSRKIELGKMTMRVSGTDHVYEKVARLAKARFSNFADIRFSYRAMLGGGIVDYVGLGGRKGGKTAGAAKRSAHNMERESRLPAIVITLR